MVLHEPLGAWPCSIPARCDLSAALHRPPGKNRPFGGIAVVRPMPGGVMRAAARSARTRRPCRSLRGRTAGSVVVQKVGRIGRNGLDGNDGVRCRDDSVKHSNLPLSPRKRAASNQITSVQSQSAATEHPLARWPRRRVSQSVVLNTFTNAAFPIVASPVGAPLLSSHSARSASATPGIQTQNSRSHIAMSYQLSFAWKASLTRTPPPICTSALGSQTALVRRASSVANG
jgi:hypothetical protein